MASDRTAWAALGLAVLGLAVLALVSPAVADRVPTAEAVARLGNDYILVAVVAAVAAAATLGVLLLRALSGVTEATPPPAETVTAERVGSGLDAALDSLPAVRVTPGHRRVHDRLRRAAVGAVAERRRCSREAASELVERGEWTADRDVTRFLADGSLDPPSIPRRLGAGLRGDDWFRRRVGATVDELEGLEGDRA